METHFPSWCFSWITTSYGYTDLCVPVIIKSVQYNASSQQYNSTVATNQTTNKKVSGLIPWLFCLHVKVCKILKLKFPFLITKSDRRRLQISGKDNKQKKNRDYLFEYVFCFTYSNVTTQCQCLARQHPKSAKNSTPLKVVTISTVLFIQRGINAASSQQQQGCL